MRQHNLSFLKLAGLLVLGLALAAGAAAQSQVRFVTAEAGDLVATDLRAPVASKALPPVSKEKVAVSWPIDRESELAAETPFVARSREYWVDVTAEDLGRGVPVYAHSAGALVRLNPAAGTDGASIDPLALELIDGKGRRWSAGEGMEKLVRADQLAKTGVPFPAGTSAFRIRPDLGSGSFELRAKGLEGQAPYVMHVLDAKSDVELTLTTSRSNYLHGQTLEIEAAMTRGERRFALEKVDGFVTSPAGRAWAVEFRSAEPGVYRATLELDALEAPAPGLWEVHASAHGRVGARLVLRGARTAFGAAVPAAGFNGRAELVDGNAGDLVVSVGLDVAAAGRYDVRGVVYGTAADGSLRPAGVVQTAAWLDAGSRSLELEISRRVMEELSAPYEVRDLRLADQGRMGVLHRQERGLVID